MKSAKKILAAILSGVLLVGALSTSIIGGKAQSITNVPQEERYALSREVASEGMVLLKNDKEALPLPTGEKLALFGNAQVAMIKCGGGSGEMVSAYLHSPLYGLQDKSEDGRVSLYDPLVKLYTKIKLQEDAPQMKVTDKMTNDAAKECDTAVFFIGRKSSESADRSLRAGDYTLRVAEKDILNKIKNAGFKKVVAVLNICGPIDTKWIEEYGVDAALVSWLPGPDGGMAVADILCGDVNPSGKLADTFTKNYEDYPSSANFSHNESIVNYEEDIFVGYRYFETFDPKYEKVAYEFGFGLSYTKFDISEKSVKHDGDYIEVTAKVTNVGSVAGKEVVQAYYGAPQGKLGNPAKELAAFKKTKLLAPGESENVIMRFAINDMASFDDIGKTGYKSAYVLEAGKYNIYIGTSVKDAGINDDGLKIMIDQLKIGEQLTQKSAPTASFKRLLADGTYETLAGNYIMPDVAPMPDVSSKPLSEIALLSDVQSGKVSMEDFLGQLSIDELISLTAGKIGKMTGSFGDITKFGIPYAETDDGPSGVRLAIPTTGLPSVTLMACTWNSELIEKLGQAAGADAKDNKIDLLLTPGMNIHRNPLCGRNFEYFSEDPVISGVLATALTKGIQSQKVAASIKHFAVNNKENGRYSSDSRVSERALREIYLKGFEIAVKNSDPWCIMSSYNKINGTYAGQNKDLLTGVLRNEWGFDNMIVTDWGASSGAVQEILAGGDLRMPDGNPSVLKSAYNAGTISRQDIERSIENILNLIMKTNAMNDPTFSPYKNIATNSSITKVKAAYVTSSSTLTYDAINDYDAGKTFKGVTASSWLEYNLEVRDAGEYVIEGRMTSITDNAGIKLSLDSQVLGDIIIEKATSNYVNSNWVTSAPLNVTLTAGTHKLKVEFIAGNVGLNYLKITPAERYDVLAKTLDELKILMNKEFEIKQKNYSPESWEKFISAITVARQVNEISTGGMVTEAYNYLHNAIDGLIENIDPTTTVTTTSTTTVPEITTVNPTTATIPVTTTATSTDAVKSTTTITSKSGVTTQVIKTTYTTETEDATIVTETLIPIVTTKTSGKDNPNTGVAVSAGMIFLMGAAVGTVIISKKKK